MPFDGVEMLGQWERDMRIKTIQMEVFTALSFDANAAAETLVVGDTSTGATQPIVTVTRPSMEEFIAQLPLVHAYSDLRVDRAAEILAQVGEIMSFIGQPLSLHTGRHRWTMEYLFAAVGGIIEAYKGIKLVFAVRRPYEMSPLIQPMITTPAHSAFPSGHSMEAFAMAEVLAQIVAPRDEIFAAAAPSQPTWRQQMMLQATRVAVNRTVAGVHYPIDMMAGAMIGRAMGEYVMARAKATGVTARTFKSTFSPPKPGQAPQAVDFNLADLQAEFAGVDAADRPQGSYYSSAAVAFTPAVSPKLAWLLGKAQDEWRNVYDQPEAAGMV